MATLTTATISAQNTWSDSVSIVGYFNFSVVAATGTPGTLGGKPGEIAFGLDGGSAYLYYCIASGNWARVQLTQLY